MRLTQYIRKYIDKKECEEGSSENWQEGETYTVKDFFNMMRDKFESLNLVSDGSITHNIQQERETNKREREINIFYPAPHQPNRCSLHGRRRRQ